MVHLNLAHFATAEELYKMNKDRLELFLNLQRCWCQSLGAFCLVFNAALCVSLNAVKYFVSVGAHF